MSSLSTLLLRVSVALAAGALLMGCGPDFERLDFIPRTTPPTSVSIQYEEVGIQVGIAIAVLALPYADGKRMDEETEVSLRSQNTNVIGVDPALENGSFVIYGVGPGTTNITVEIDGSFEGEIPASVILQQ